MSNFTSKYGFRFGVKTKKLAPTHSEKEWINKYSAKCRDSTILPSQYAKCRSTGGHPTLAWAASWWRNFAIILLLLINRLLMRVKLVHKDRGNIFSLDKDAIRHSIFWIKQHVLDTNAEEQLYLTATDVYLTYTGVEKWTTFKYRLELWPPYVSKWE